MFLLYLDPGSGSILIQLLVAGAAAATLAIAMSWRKVKSFFTRNKNTAATQDDDDENDDQPGA